MRLRPLMIFALANILALPLTACDPFNTTFDDVEDAELYEAEDKEPAPEKLDRLVVMNWNVKFGGGRIDFFFDCYGDRVIMEQGEVLETLEGLAEKIKQVDPDIVLLQEVDTNSKRSAYVDQMQWLLDHTDLNYGAYASQWRASYIPKHSLGRVDTGNGMLSRWPMDHAERLALPLIGEQDPVTQYFYLKRNILRAKVDIPGEDPLWIANTHTAAFAQDGTRARQVELFKEELEKFDEQGKTFAAGGDLNTVPPGSERIKNFPDSICEDEDFQADDYTSEVGLLDPFYERWQPAISLERYRENNEPFATHTTDKSGFWNRKLDYLFTNGEFVEGSGMVHQDAEAGGMATMPLSDHAPVVVELAWPPDRRE